MADRIDLRAMLEGVDPIAQAQARIRNAVAKIIKLKNAEMFEEYQQLYSEADTLKSAAGYIADALYERSVELGVKDRESKHIKRSNPRET